MKRFDVVVLGAGIVGLTVARALRLRSTGSVCVLEKEAALGRHASGRNSGVVHAGIYYSPGSLKSKLCVAGARMLAEYAKKNGIAFERTGKVIVASHAQELPELERLYRQARENGVRIEKITPARLAQLEPEAFTVECALHSPETAVIDPGAVLGALERELLSMGCEIRKSALVKVAGEAISVNGEALGYGHLVNAAGLHADEIAHAMGAGRRYRILPFKGIYKKLRQEAAKRFRSSIYPVPDPELPFLGVHLTRSVSGEVYAGPTAMPAFGRENYGRLQGFSLGESPRILGDLASMVVRNANGFRTLVREEVPKYGGQGFYASVKKLAPRLEPEDLLACEKVGIRAQLIDGGTGRMVNDFVVEKGPRSTHILNAVSPGFTASFAFAETVVDGMDRSAA